MSINEKDLNNNIDNLYLDIQNQVLGGGGVRQIRCEGEGEKLDPKHVGTGSMKSLAYGSLILDIQHN